MGLAGLRGQGSFEYLMANAWALMLVIVVGAAFWQLGVLQSQPSGISAVGFTYFRLLNALSTVEGGKTLLVFTNTAPGTVVFIPSESFAQNKITGQRCTDLVFTPNNVPQGGQFTVETGCIPGDQA
jgi:hypothetical protein